jgi:hypothetical protein
VDPAALADAWERFYDFADQAPSTDEWLGFLGLVASQDALEGFLLGAQELLPGTDDPELAVRYGAMVGFLVALSTVALEPRVAG